MKQPLSRRTANSSIIRHLSVGRSPQAHATYFVALVAITLSALTEAGVPQYFIFLLPLPQLSIPMALEYGM